MGRKTSVCCLQQDVGQWKHATNKLERHLTSSHEHFLNRPSSFFFSESKWFKKASVHHFTIHATPTKGFKHAIKQGTEFLSFKSITPFLRVQPAAIELVNKMKRKAAKHFKLVPLSNDLLEKKCIILPSNLQSVFLQRPCDLEIYSVHFREFIKLWIDSWLFRPKVPIVNCPNKIPTKLTLPVKVSWKFRKLDKFISITNKPWGKCGWQFHKIFWDSTW